MDGRQLIAVERVYDGSHSECINDVELAPNLVSLSEDIASCSLVSGSTDLTVKLWRYSEKFARSFVYTGHVGCVNSVAFSPCGQIILSASSDRSVRVWTCKHKGATSVFRAHTSPVYTVRAGKHGQHFLTTSADKSIKLWQLSDQRFVRSFIGHTNAVKSACFSSLDDHLISSCSFDKSVRLWDARNTASASCLKDATSPLTCVQSRAVLLAACDEKGCIYVWDMRIARLLLLFNVHDGCTNSICFHPQLDILVSTSNDKTLKIHSLTEGRTLATIRHTTCSFTTARFDHCGDRLISGDSTGGIAFWRFHSGALASHLSDSCLAGSIAAVS